MVSEGLLAWWDCNLGILSENQVIYHRGERGGCKSFETVFNPLCGSAHSAVVYDGMAISLDASVTPGVTHECGNVV